MRSLFAKQALTCHSWADLREQLRIRRQWLFRGHGSADWCLETTLERTGIPADVRSPAEELMLARFKQAPADILMSPPTNRLGWLALLQHHGAPTRLLDFSLSPYVAAYFAIEDVKPTETAAVWAIDAVWIQRRGAELLGDRQGTIASRTMLADEWAVIMPAANGVVLLGNERHNVRQFSQQGVFLTPCSLERSFEQSLAMLAEADDATARVQCFLIPGAWRSEMLRDLTLMNITRASLYPGLDGFAQSLKYSLEIV